MKRISLILIFMVLMGGMLVTPAETRPRGHGYRGHSYRGHGFRHRFYRHPVHAYHRGRWHYGRHGHRVGWWWVIDGGWYWYPAPVYPYPYSYPYSYVPPVIVQTPQATPPVAVQPQPQPQTAVWYYCEQPQGYYPYVSECPGGWKTVPAIPPDSPAEPSSSPSGEQKR